MGSDQVDGTTRNPSCDTEQVAVDSYAETDNPEIEAVVQFYERKIGIFENTLELFKENLLRVNNRFNALRLAHRPLKEAHEKLIEEHEILAETNHNLSMDLKKKSTTIELERNRNNDLESQIKCYEKTFEKHNSIFDYLEVNVLEMLKYVSGSKCNEKKWRLVKLHESNQDMSSSFEHPCENTLNAEQKDVSSHYEADRPSNFTAINQESLKIQFLPQMDLCFGPELGESPIRRKSVPFSSSPKQTTTKHTDTSSLDVILEEKSFLPTQLFESSSQLDLLDNSATLAKCDGILGSPNVKICPTYQHLQEYNNENGCFVFVPDNDYFRVRAYLCSDDFDWEAKDIRVQCPKQRKKMGTIDLHNDSSTDHISISFNEITYNTVHDIPAKQPIDGNYVITDGEDKTVASHSDGCKTFTFEELLNLDDGNTNRSYRFLPNLQYSYLSGVATLPKFFKDLLPTRVSGKEQSFNCGNDIWPFRRVVYTCYQKVPPLQPVSGFYVFVHNKNFNKKIKDRSSKVINRRSIRISPGEIVSKDGTATICSTRKFAPFEPNSPLSDESSNQIMNEIFSQLSSTNKNSTVLSVFQHEDDENNRDKSFAASPKPHQTPLESSNEETPHLKKKKRALTLKKHKSLLNPFIQFNMKTDPTKPEQTAADSDKPHAKSVSSVSLTISESSAECSAEITKKKSKRRKFSFRKSQK